MVSIWDFINIMHQGIEHIEHLKTIKKLGEKIFESLETVNEQENVGSQSLGKNQRDKKDINNKIKNAINFYNKGNREQSLEILREARKIGIDSNLKQQTTKIQDLMDFIYNQQGIEFWMKACKTKNTVQKLILCEKAKDKLHDIKNKNSFQNHDLEAEILHASGIVNCELAEKLIKNANLKEDFGWLFKLFSSTDSDLIKISAILHYQEMRDPSTNHTPNEAGDIRNKILQLKDMIKSGKLDVKKLKELNIKPLTEEELFKKAIEMFERSKDNTTDLETQNKSDDSKAITLSKWGKFLCNSNKFDEAGKKYEEALGCAKDKDVIQEIKESISSNLPDNLNDIFIPHQTGDLDTSAHAQNPNDVSDEKELADFEKTLVEISTQDVQLARTIEFNPNDASGEKELADFEKTLVEISTQDVQLAGTIESNPNDASGEKELADFEKTLVEISTQDVQLAGTIESNLNLVPDY